MLKRLFRAAALLLLCTLLVYAPELLASVRAPYGVKTDRRVLLRIVLCTQDSDAASAFYKAVSSYQMARRSLHLRITRTAPNRIGSLPSPKPDLYVFSPDGALAPEALFWPLRSEEDVHDPDQGVWQGMRYAAPLSCAGSPLLCAVSADARERDAALDLLDALTAD